MSTKSVLCEQLAQTISDYRTGAIKRPDAAHVDRWVSQFDLSVQTILLQELNHVLQHTYFPKRDLESYLLSLLQDKTFSEGDPKNFWSQAHIFNIQENGSSQKELREVLISLGNRQFGPGWNQPAIPPKYFVYLDDIVFSGHRIMNDLKSWMQKNTPNAGSIKIVVMAAHEGNWDLCRQLKEEATALGKNLNFEIHASRKYENRKAYRNQSDVLWPVNLPNTPEMKAYMEKYQTYQYIGRTPQTVFSSKVFSSEAGRSLLETQMLLAGVKIISFSQNPKFRLPLGFGDYGLGFGGLAITYRNCPNNAPLALWWGDPEANPRHPFSKWYPLLPRKTYYA